MIKKKLHIRWSPEQISCRLKREKQPSVNVETIYQYVYKDNKNGGELWRNLRRGPPSRRPRLPSVKRHGTIKDTTPIAKLSKTACTRNRPGERERDTMLGLDRSCSILASIDKKSR